MARPVNPIHTVSIGRVVASQVEAVEIGMMTLMVPPSTFESHRTRSSFSVVVVLVSSAEFLPKMIR